MAYDKQHHLQDGNNSGKKINNVFEARVIDNSDPLDSQRIRVRIKGLDDKVLDENLPWCDSFLPLMHYVLPKRDELVKILLFNTSEPNMRRQWIGPIISQFQSLSFDSYLTANRNSALSNQTPNKGVSKIPSAKGIYPSKDDVAVLGRDNTDVLLKSNLVLIRAGKFVQGNNIQLNTTNPAYLHLRMLPDGSKSYAATVANQIYLIGYNGATNYNSILTDKILDEIFTKADPAVLGNPLRKLLKYLITFVLTHVHTSGEMSPNPGSPKFKELTEFDLETLFSQIVKLN